MQQPPQQMMPGKSPSKISGKEAAVIIMMCLAAAGGYAYYDGNHPSSTYSGPAIKVTADELAAAYDANKFSADARFKDKPVEVTGAIADIDSGLGGDPELLLGSSLLTAVRVEGLPKNVVAGLTKGSTLTVSCTCVGMPLRPRLTGCVVKN